MNPDTIQSLLYLYGFVAVVASICVASSLEERQKSRLPATRPYRWGFYNGCMGVACAPLALLFLVAMVASAMAGKGEAFGSSLVYSVWLTACALCGWFIIERKRWAWVVGTVLSFNILVWIINCIYGRNRWGECVGEPYNSAEDEGYELLHEATKLEAGGKAQEALTLYQSIIERYPHTAASGDAQKSAESLRAKLGLACPAAVETATAPLLPPPQDAKGDAGGLAPVRADGSRPNLEPELMAALAARGADIMDFGIRDFEPWAAKLLASLGETIASKVRPDLRQIYNAAQEEVRIRQGRLQTAERAPASPAVSVGTQAEGDTGQARLAAVAKPATEAPLICSQTNSQPSDEPPRQIPAPMGPRPRWKTRKATFGLGVTFTIIAGLAAVWIWRCQVSAQKPTEAADLGDVSTLPNFGEEAGAQKPTEAENHGQNTNRIRSQAIASWFSNVTITTITETADATTAETDYRSNAVSQAEFAATKVKAERGDAVAQYQLSKLYGWLVGGRTSVAEGKKWIQKAAEQGLPEAQLEIGWSFYKKDLPEALRWFRKAADQGHPEAQRIVGQCYRIGEGVRANDHEAFLWYCRAGEGGNIEAQKNLAAFYDTGVGVAKDVVKGTYWYRKAAEQGDAESQYRLGWAYQSGQGVDTNAVEAVKWYRKAADQGDADAQCNLGVCYSDGKGVRQDYAEAVKWYRKAADQGDAIGQNSLGASYANGEGVQQDCAEAVKWYRKAADQGEAAGQHNLGKCYADGQGTPQNDIEAYKWLSLAAAQGLPAEARDGVAQRMARAEIVEAQRRAAAFVAKKEGGGGGAGGISPTPEIAGGKGCVGTGFFVSDDGYFVTCEHVVRGATSFYVRSPSGSLPARLIKKDRTIDVAVLKVDGAFRALPVAAQPRVKLGEAVFTIGFLNPGVQGVEPKLTRGEISSMAGARDNPRYYQISVPVQPGNSGGALLDECGNAVGVVTSRLDDVATYQASGALPQNVNYAVKGGLVYNFLSGVPELSGKLKALRTGRDREAASATAERAAVLVVAE
jgi:hypothetical protein